MISSFEYSKTISFPLSTATTSVFFEEFIVVFIDFGIEYFDASFPAKIFHLFIISE